MGWTSPKSWAVGDLLTSSDMNTYVRDNMSFAASAASQTILTNEGTTSTSFTDLATVGPTVSIVTGTKALVIIGGGLVNNTASTDCIMGFQVSGASSVTAADTAALHCGPGGAASFFPLQSSYVVAQTGLTPGTNVFTAKYRASADTANFQNRVLSVIPLP